MERKLSIILFLCASIWSQEIFSKTEGSDKSSSLEIPKKHAIDRLGEHSAKIEDVPYFVIVQENGYTICGAGILSSIIAITSASCFDDKNGTYRILSGSSSLHNGTSHEIVKKIIHPKYDKHKIKNNLALVVVSPPFDLVNSPNRDIPLYKGKFPSNATGIISVWICDDATDDNLQASTTIRSWTIPIMNSNKCNQELVEYKLSNKEFCVNDESGYRNSCGGNFGGTFVVDGKLLGIFFMNLQSKYVEMLYVLSNLADPEYASWISSNMHH